MEVSLINTFFSPSDIIAAKQSHTKESFTYTGAADIFRGMVVGGIQDGLYVISPTCHYKSLKKNLESPFHPIRQGK